MKIVIRRHDRPFAIFRCLAIAQALTRISGAEVYLECLENWKGILELAPSIRWKNPHHPFAVHERGQLGQKGHRPAGKLYDEIIDLDGDGPFEARWSQTGMNWWAWAVNQLGVELDRFAPQSTSAVFGRLQAWPRIEAPLGAGGGRPAPLNYVLVDAISDEISPFGVNANLLEERIKKEWPGSEILYSVRHPQAHPGGGRTRLLAGSYLQLAQQIAAARAVYAVNGMVFALSQSRLAGEEKLQPRTTLIRPAPERLSDPFGRIRGLFFQEVPGIPSISFLWGRRSAKDKASGVESFEEDRTKVELAPVH